MLSVHTQHSLREPGILPIRHLDLSPPHTSTLPYYAQGSGGGGYPPKKSSSPSSHPPPAPSPEEIAVAQVLEIARESDDGALDPTVNTILDAALAKTWAKVQSQPDSYVMTRDEFAVFNYFQHRFQGNKMAVAARKLYWDNTTA